MKLSEKTRAEFNRLRKEGMLSKVLAYGSPDYIEGRREIFPEYALSEKIPLAEAFGIVSEDRVCRDFGCTELKYKLYEAYRNAGLQLDNTVLVNFTTELVSAFAVEDLDNMLVQYEQMLVGLGKNSVKPLQDFIATEGKIQIIPGLLHPTKENYDIAKRTLNKILSS